MAFSGAKLRHFKSSSNSDHFSLCIDGLWDSKSTGTSSNVIELLSHGKKAGVFVNKEKKFENIKGVDDFKRLLEYMSDLSIKKADEKNKSL